MEKGLYDELELVFAKIGEYEQRDEEVPIMELYFCYTVRPPLLYPTLLAQNPGSTCIIVTDD